MWPRIAAWPATGSFPGLQPRRKGRGRGQRGIGPIAQSRSNAALVHSLGKGSAACLPLVLHFSSLTPQASCQSAELLNIPFLTFSVSVSTLIAIRTMTDAYLKTISLVVGVGKPWAEEKVALKIRCRDEYAKSK